MDKQIGELTKAMQQMMGGFQDLNQRLEAQAKAAPAARPAPLAYLDEEEHQRDVLRQPEPLAEEDDAEERGGDQLRLHDEGEELRLEAVEREELEHLLTVVDRRG